MKMLNGAVVVDVSKMNQSEILKAALVFHDFFFNLLMNDIQRVNKYKYTSDKETYILSFNDGILSIFLVNKDKRYYLPVDSPICSQIINTYMQ